MTDASRLTGCWKLVSFLQQDTGGNWADALGEGAEGYIHYWPSGQMTVLIGGRARPRFRGAWDAIAAEEKARALDNLVAYAGTYDVVGDQVRHHVEICWIPNWQGRDLVRAMSFPEEDVLVLRTVPAEMPAGAPQQEVIWRRVG